MTRRAAAGKWALAAGVFLFVDLLGGQAASRLVAAPTQRDFVEREQAFRTDSDVFHHGLRPNRAVVANWGKDYAVATNSLGFKDTGVRDVPLRAPRRRVLFVGDSFTEGVGYTYDETFVGILGRALQPRGIDVLNSGCASYSPSIYDRKTRHYLQDVGLEVHEVVVLIDVSDIHDEALFYALDGEGNVVDAPSAPKVEGMAAASPAESSGFKGALKKYFLSVRVADMIKDIVEGQHWSGAFVDEEAMMAGLVRNPRSAWTLDDDAYRKYGVPGLVKSRRAMERLADFLSARDIVLTVAVYPWPTQIYRSDRNSRQLTYWRQWAERRGVGFIDLFEPFFDAAPMEVLERYYIPWDSHWNGQGHALVAKRLLQHWKR